MVNQSYNQLEFSIGFCFFLVLTFRFHFSLILISFQSVFGNISLISLFHRGLAFTYLFLVHFVFVWARHNV